MGYQLQLPLPTGRVQGLKYLAQVKPLLHRLHAVGTGRDTRHQREFFFDQYVGLLLVYFFNPALTSLRSVQQATDLAAVQRRVGCRRVSLGALSEAGSVFDPEPVREMLVELASQVGPAQLPTEHEALRTLTAVDGSLLPALPRMAWALWQDDAHRAGKVHLHFEVARGIPIEASVTPGKESEVRQLKQHLQAGRLYVLDRYYAAYALLADILTARASFIVRLKGNAAFTVAEERPLLPAARAAGVVRDVVVSRLGTSHHKNEVHQPLRLIEVTSGTSTLLLATDRLDLPAELIALAYRYRWTVELFFRWLKCILGCRHWLGESLKAVTIQVYVALIATLLLSLWANQKPTKRTFELVRLLFMGWASEAEVQRHLEQLQPQPLHSG